MRNRFFLAVLVILAALTGNLAWGQANLPNNPNAVTIQGPDPSGMLGYPLATVPATGALPWPVTVTGAGGVVTQGTTPWVTDPWGATHSAAGTLTVQDQAVTLACGNSGTISVSMLASAGWSGQIVFEGTVNGTDWHEWPGTANAEVLGTSGERGYLYIVNSQTAGSTLLMTFAGAGLQQFRVRARFYNAGSLAVSINGSAGASYPLATVGPVPSQAVGGTMPVATPMLTDVFLNVWRSPGTVAISSASIPTGNGYFSALDWSLQSSLGSSGAASLDRSPDVFKTVATTAAGNTALWTPAAGKKFRLMRWRYTITGSATTAGGADILVKLFDGAAGVTGQQDTVTVPAAATTLQGQLAASPWIDLGNGYLSTAANNVLNVNLSAALSAGTVTVEAVGTEE